jgi:hypothetical protein
LALLHAMGLHNDYVGFCWFLGGDSMTWFSPQSWFGFELLPCFGFGWFCVKIEMVLSNLCLGFGFGMVLIWLTKLKWVPSINHVGLWFGLFWIWLI